MDIVKFYSDLSDILEWHRSNLGRSTVSKQKLQKLLDEAKEAGLDVDVSLHILDVENVTKYDDEVSYEENNSSYDEESSY